MCLWIRLWPNRKGEQVLRCMRREKPKHWSRWLALAEYWYNTNFQSPLQMTPFEVLYGVQSQLVILHQVPNSAQVEVKDFLKDRMKS